MFRFPELSHVYCHNTTEKGKFLQNYLSLNRWPADI